MAFELVAARILAPSIGSSTYVWTSVIGVIIAALSLGYWCGGVLADRRKASSDVVWLLIVSATLTTLTLLIYSSVLTWVVAAIPDSRAQAVVASLLLFAPVSFLLGAVSPYLVKLNVTTLETSGRRVASLSACNSVGGISGTFITGFILFGYVGSRETLGIVVILLLIASWLLVRGYRYGLRLVISVLLAVVTLLPVPRTVGVTNIDTASAHYQVVQYTTHQGDVVGLTMGPTGIQSAVYTSGHHELVFWYTRELARFALETKPKNILILGGGAFTLPQYLAEKLPDSQIDVVEIDPELEQISKKYFYYQSPDNVRLYFDDARTFINQTTTTYDAIIVDAYGDSEIPFGMMTAEFGDALASRLTQNGVVYVNLVAGTEGPCRDVFAAVDATYRTPLPHAEYTHGSTNNRWANYIVAYARQPIELSGTMMLTPLGGERYTDNFAPAERLNFVCRQEAYS